MTAGAQQLSHLKQCHAHVIDIQCSEVCERSVGFRTAGLTVLWTFSWMPTPASRSLIMRHGSFPRTLATSAARLYRSLIRRPGAPAHSLSSSPALMMMGSILHMRALSRRSDRASHVLCITDAAYGGHRLMMQDPEKRILTSNKA